MVTKPLLYLVYDKNNNIVMTTMISLISFGCYKDTNMSRTIAKEISQEIANRKI